MEKSHLPMMRVPSGWAIIPLRRKMYVSSQAWNTGWSSAPLPPASRARPRAGPSRSLLPYRDVLPSTQGGKSAGDLWHRLPGIPMLVALCLPLPAFLFLVWSGTEVLAGPITSGAQQ